MSAHRSIYVRLPIKRNPITAVTTNTRPQRFFFFRFKPAFWWTSIDRYYGFSRVGELWLSETELRGKFTIGGGGGGEGF